MNALQRALETDLALSERQVWRYYGETLEACSDYGFAVQSALVAPTVHRRPTRRVNFVLLEPRNFERFELRHLAGVAEARHLLGVQPRDWQVIEHTNHSSPDAIWQRGLETWAVEFDAGAYSRASVFAKVQAFRSGFDGQIWAVSSGARRETVARWLNAFPLLTHPF
jgi:hypothetical protein